MPTGYRVQTAKRDRLYLKARRGGMPCSAIAKKFGVDLKTVYRGIERARLAEQPAGTEHKTPPRLEPLFPIAAFSPESACPHYGPIRPGSIFCCMVCSRSGHDGHPALRRDPRTDPRPDPKPAEKPKAKKTRKERRRKSPVERVEPSNN